MSRDIAPAIYLFLGYAGTGKFTVAAELTRQLQDRGVEVRLLDNHRVANLVFDLIAEADGSSPLPPPIFDRVREINLAVLGTVRELSPRDWSFVFTHYFVDSDRNRQYVEALSEAATDRGALFVPVVLSCDWDELLRRLPRPDRVERQKLTDTRRAAEMLEDALLVPAGALHLDITERSPADAASAVLDHVEALAAAR